MLVAWMAAASSTVNAQQPAQAPVFDDLDPPAPLPVAWQHRPALAVLEEEVPLERIFGELLGEPGREPEDRAALLLQRARVRQCLWRLSEALADLDAATALAPRSVLIPLERARLLGALGRPDDASIPLQLAFRRDPESLETAAVLGVLRFEQGRYREAAEALSFHLEDGDPADPLRWLHATAMRRAGRATTMTWQGWLGPRDSWPGPLEAFIAGRIERTSLFALARTVESETRPQVACLTWFYAGERALETHDRDRAVRDFFGVLRSGYTAAVEYRLAVAELVRLGAIVPAD